ncbi:hypothetical protein [Streptomyces botrytidirepellens]|uniref:hypothetical protein n=1 Tax=Streptomyces botrytidirepellens TaxID=2486417 RepID=UPI0011CE10CD|nr:hypothetical protein [Streptomyces botrytidirepellens]
MPRKAQAAQCLELTVAEGFEQTVHVDSGIAAILGAVVGALGTGGAAVVTGVWAAKTAQHQAAAQDAQARRQLRAEHVRERRGPRSKAYADFVAQARVIERALGRYQDSHILEMGQFNQEVDKLDYLGVQVLLEGPPSVIRPSQDLISCAHRCMRPLRVSIAALHEFGDESSEYAAAKSAVGDVGFELIAEVKDFAEAARRVLDDDGAGQADASVGAQVATTATVARDAVADSG